MNTRNGGGHVRRGKDEGMAGGRVTAEKCVTAGGDAKPKAIPNVKEIVQNSKVYRALIFCTLGHDFDSILGCSNPRF